MTALHDVYVYRDGDYAVATDKNGNVVAGPDVDHAAVIQAAINALTTTPNIAVKTGTIHFAPGQYVLNKSIVITPDDYAYHVRLVGNAFNTTQLRVNGDFPALKITNNVYPTIINNLGIWVNEGIAYTNYMIDLYKSGALKLVRCHLGRGNGVRLVGGETTLITQNWFEKTPTAIHIVARDDYNTLDILIHNNVMLLNGGTGVYAEWNEEANRFLYYLSVIGNHIFGYGTEAGVVLRTVKRSTVADNIMYALSYGVKEEQYADYNLIANNILYNVATKVVKVGPNTLVVNNIP